MGRGAEEMENSISVQFIYEVVDSLLEIIFL